MRNRSLRISLATALIVGSGAVLSAQQSTGAIKGRVVDQNGAGMSGVTVTITNAATTQSRTATTNANGTFFFAALQVGNYNISYTSNGLTYKQARTASLGLDTDASFKWPNAAVTTVDIVGTSPVAAIIDNTSSQVGVTVSSQMIDSLPLVSRDINQAAIIAPSVSIVQGSQIDPTKKTSTYIQTGDGGGRGTNFTVDGGDNNSTDVGGYVLHVPVDAIEEFQVVTNQFQADFGRATSGFFNIVTKSGGNDFRGSASAQYTNQSMRALSTDEHEKQDNAKGIYDLHVDGPIIKDHLFFAVTAERQQGSSASYTFSPYSIANDPTLKGVQQGVVEKNVYAKIDWAINSNMNFAGTYGYYQDETPNQAFPRTTGFNGNVFSAALGTGANKTWAASGKLTWSITPNLVWESQYHYFDYTNGIHPDGTGPGNGSPIGVTDITSPNNPRPDTFNLGWGGLDPNTIQNTGIKRGQFKNDLTWMTGNHTLKAGFDLQRTTYADQQLFFNETGVYRTRVAGLDPVTGNPVTYASAFAPTVSADQNVESVALVANGFENGTSFHQYSIYLQDNWALNNQWTIYGGIRVDWDTQLDYLSKYNSVYAGIRQATDANLGPQGAAGIGNAAPTGKKYWQPRLQVQYKPNDKLTFKFGAGRFVAQVIDNVTGFTRGLGNRANGLPGGTIWNNAARVYQGSAPKTTGNFTSSFGAGSVLGTVNGNNIVLPADLTPYNYANNVGGLRDYFRNTVDSWLTTGTADTDGKSLLASDFQFPSTTAINLGFAYTFNEHNAVEVTAVYSKTKHLTTNLTLDGSGPAMTEYSPSGATISDSVFFSNQQASSTQLQTKYTYSSAKTSFIATLTIANEQSSEGGAAGAFDGSGASAGLYGEGSPTGWTTLPERHAAGSTTFMGSFVYAYTFDWGTQISALGQWHSGRAYDVTLGYSPNTGPGGAVDAYDPIPVAGYREGAWNMDISLNVTQTFKFGTRFSVAPFITVQNLLNNYDYGANYDGTMTDGATGGVNPNFGQRGPGFQVNQPRNFAVGVKVKF
ncbi:MAG: carboxypeptidase regulatory-like domain-containing protein [Acidobacteria bacterium]|nr:carboxypeptidase regulatory-like domain-containing protein [Acidobacteriota bacterium]